MEKQSIFKPINETTKKELDFNIKTIYHKVLNDPLLSFFFTKSFLIIIYVFLAVSLLAFIAFLLLLVFVYSGMNIGLSKIVTLITFILCTILFLIFYSRSFENKVRRKLHNDILKCWQIITKDSYTSIYNVTNIFSLKPDNVTA